MALGVKSVTWSSTSQFVAIGSYDEKVRIHKYYPTTTFVDVYNILSV